MRCAVIQRHDAINELLRQPRAANRGIALEERGERREILGKSFMRRGRRGTFRHEENSTSKSEGKVVTKKDISIDSGTV